jgi:hypothetical protein
VKAISFGLDGRESRMTFGLRPPPIRRLGQDAKHPMELMIYRGSSLPMTLSGVNLT